MDATPIKITLKSYSEPATKRVTECVERFQLKKHDIKITSRFHSNESDCDIIVIEGVRESLLKLARYIEMVERLAKEWVVPVLGE